MQLKDEDVLIWHREHKPLKLKRTHWRDHPILRLRQDYKAPQLEELPPITDTWQIDLKPYFDNHPDEMEDLISSTIDDPDNLPLLSETREDSFIPKNPAQPPYGKEDANPSLLTMISLINPLHTAFLPPPYD